ncbi:MAG: carboxypeptidase regulatory-like domain-containing protein [Chitinophagaceae bacterium]|nr:carboxypeptidase regulatory-like domain-containing protein [Chitinophagaceae bacterium]
MACGSKSGDFQITNTTDNWVSQTIGTSLPVGTVINASVYAGTHDNSYYHEVGVYFFDANWNWISGSSVEVNKILANSPAGPQLYTWTAVVPAGTKYTQVGYSGNGNWIKTDQWCVTLGTGTTVALGNQLFVDLNGNGIKDGGDWGYDGVTVKLYADANEDGVPDGTALKTTTTSGGGFYNFANLAAGKYLAQIENAPSWMFVVPKNGGDPDNNIDDDNNGLSQTGTTIKGGTITLSVGGEPGSTSYNSTYDFAVYKTNGIGDYVFLDADADGIQDAGYDPAQYGTYNYQLQFVTPTGYTPSPANQGSDDNKDSDPVSGIIPAFTVPNGTWNNSFDAGFSTTLSLGNRVWNDANNNGLNDSENGIAGVTVNLYADANNDNVADGASIQTQTTDANGYYQFNGLQQGNYIVGVVTPSGYMSSAVNGGDPDNNNNIDDNGQIIAGNETRGLAITLAFGTEPLVDGNTNPNINITYDFGFLPDCNCTSSSSNLLVNGSFESGTTGWSWSSGSLTTGTGYIACGSANGFNNWSSGTSKVWQNVTIAAGSTVIFSAYAGTHTAGISCSPKLSLIFLNSSNAVIGQTDVTVTRDVDVNFNQLAYYSITAVAPAGTVKARVQSSITCNTMKIDAFCLTATSPVNLGNLVWYDRNNNGTQDAGETGVSGATVKIYLDANSDNTPDGPAIATTTTDASGIYSFAGLVPNKYVVGVTIPAGYAAATTTATSASPDNDDNTDNNGVAVVSGEVRSNYITLTTLGEPTTDGDGSNGNLTLDFGLKGTGSIGDFVWNDLNGNGIQDTGELGISGTIVTLTYPGGATVTTTTDANGAYSFINLAPGTYSVSFTTPSGFVPAPSNEGSDDSKDSDPVSGVVGGIVLTAGQSNTTVDAGFQSNQLNLANYVSYDQNNNGHQDAGEQVISGVTVNLYKDANGDSVPDGAAIANTATNASGEYSFTGLTPGNYIVGVVPPAGYTAAATTATSASPNNDNNTDNNGVTTVSGELRSNFITLTTGGEPASGVDGDGTNGNLTLDFGLRGTGIIGDFVWNDLNGNGIQDSGEPGIGGATVTLTYPGGATVTTTTDANGAYSFANLAPGTYSVSFTTPAGFVPAPSNQGSDDSKDSDPVSGVVSGIVLTAGQSNTTVDAGFQSNQLNIGNYVWYDKNNDGIQDANETGISGVSVKLYKDADGNNIPDGAAAATTTTVAGGAYNFSGLTPGNYIVGITAPAGYAMGYTTTSSLLPNNDDNTDNNGITIIGTEITSNLITLAALSEPTTDGDGSNGNLTLDFGLKGTGIIGDFVWNDLDGDGFQDAGEPGIGGATVTLTYPDGATVTTTTDANGAYSFANLAPGTYSVSFTTPAGFTSSPANQGGDDSKDSDPVAGVVSGINLSAGQTNLTIDAGFQSNQLILGNYVWYDKNNNGVQDAGETPIANATVRLYADANGDSVPDGAAIATTATNASGEYSFTGLTPGNYIVGVVPPAGYTAAATAATSASPNNDNNTDNNGVAVVSGEVRSNYITLTTLGEPTTDGDGSNGNLTLDFGLTGTGSLGNFVWRDLNNNGLQDAGEPGISGITVTLTNPDGSTESTTTNATGAYQFTNLIPGTYSVAFGTPAGYIPATSNAGSNDAIDSDPVGGVVTGITLTAGESNQTIDAGYRKLVNISGNVWHDVNALDDNLVNNTGPLQTPPASVIPTGLRAYLVNASTGLIERVAFVNSTTGTYSFTNITPNTNYYIYLSFVSVGVGNPPPPALLPEGWEHTGQKLGITTGSDGINDGRLTVPVLTSDVINANFGIRTSTGEVVIG